MIRYMPGTFAVKLSPSKGGLSLTVYSAVTFQLLPYWSYAVVVKLIV